MEITINSPFSVSLTLLFIGIGFAVGALFTAYNVLWRFLLKPRFEAKDDQLKVYKDLVVAKEEHIKISKTQVNELKTKLEEVKHSEAFAHIQILQGYISEKDQVINELRDQVDNFDSTQIQEKNKLIEQFDSVQKEKNKLLSQLKEQKDETNKTGSLIDDLQSKIFQKDSELNELTRKLEGTKIDKEKEKNRLLDEIEKLKQEKTEIKHDLDRVEIEKEPLSINRSKVMHKGVLITVNNLKTYPVRVEANITYPHIGSTEKVIIDA